MPLRHSSNRSDLRTLFSIVLLAGLAACGGGSGDPATVAPAADFDSALKGRVTVSGVSAGGFMAVQSHVAYAERIGGAGVIAAGPYHCAEGNIQYALSRCMTGEGLAVEPLVAFAANQAGTGAIAPLAELESARVWIFHSPADAVVAPSAGSALAEFYRAFVPDERVVLVDDVEAAHGWPTLDAGAACLEPGGDYINDCDFDAAGAILEHLYGDLAARAPDASGGTIVAADFSAYFGPDSSVAKSGYLYVPDACRNDAGECGLHIVFHGCVQGAEFVEDRFVTQAGFNEWAASNSLIVAYPQLEKSLFNPKGCWDWWGYTDGDYDLRSGKQVAGVAALIDAYVSGTLLP